LECWNNGVMGFRNFRPNTPSLQILLLHVSTMEKRDEHPDRTLNQQQAEIDRLKKELEREHNLYLRALADYENYRKRMERERATAAQSGKREIILSLLDLLDGFNLALQHMDDATPSVFQGVEALHRKFLALLQREGVTPILAVGEMFNPQFHDAIGFMETEEVAPGAVAEEVQRGYRWGDELLRPARVRVAR
jgi:molecular chaperone GrpE